ncbi:hypothetical protein [Thalassococcus lentus]|uniref:Holin-X, holin superfamily III n=1 Tax=Thalassococcus lentus TaxID=1210524 RepID=A0ABT4XUW1_9RHOB|nr:hypothetical protein [Thalassococcus lentus]MDA7425745.1 hypothetical protein [Thalassococcus lentus]
MSGDFAEDDVSKFVRATERLKYNNNKWVKAAAFVPFLGTAVQSVLDFANLRSKFLVERTMAEAGVPTSKVLGSVLTGLVALLVLVFLAFILNPFDASGSGAKLIFSVLLVGLAVVLVPMIATGFAVLIGTLGHMRGKGEKGFILNSNLAHLAKRNIFSPKE